MRVKRSKQWKGKCRFRKEPTYNQGSTKKYKKSAFSSRISGDEELIRANEELFEKQRIFKKKKIKNDKE